MNLFSAMEENREEVDDFEVTDSSPNCLRNPIIAWPTLKTFAALAQGCKLELKHIRSVSGNLRC